MTHIQESLDKLINSLLSDNVDSELVSQNWRDYSSLFPDLSKAMNNLQNAVIEMFRNDGTNNNDIVIGLGQVMENLRWSINRN